MWGFQTLNWALDARGRFGLAQDAAIASWARLQMPSATEVRRHVETTTTFVHDILTCTISWAQPNVI